MKPTAALAAFASLAALFASHASAEIPSILNYQGRVTVGGTNYNGAGQFKFALVRGDNTFAWRSDGSTNSGEPETAVSVNVSQGLYSTLLGDTTISNMAAIPSEVFTNSNIGLRVWFSDGGTNGFILLTPDQRIGASGYALRAATAESATITNVVGDLAVGGTLTVGKLMNGTHNALYGPNAVVGGGNLNSANYTNATVGGGEGNTARANAVVAGGVNNEAFGDGAAVAGGIGNSAYGENAAIAGGFFNYATGQYSVVGGGFANTAGGLASTVPGGQYNAASGSNSVAMGYRAKANKPGAFVWSDSSVDEDFSSAETNQFSVRAAGGARFETAGAGLTIDGVKVLTQNSLTNITNNIGVAGALNVSGPLVASSGLEVQSGSFRIGGGNPGAGRVLVSDENGYVSWRPLEEVAAMNQYTYTPQAFAENIAEIGIAGVLTNNINVSVVNGPGFVIERVAGANPHNTAWDYPGLNREMDFVFDYSGPKEAELSAWLAASNTTTVTITARQEGSPIYNWTLSNYRLSTVNPAPSGGKRYTLVHPGLPDGTLDVVRDNAWLYNATVGPAGMPQVEIGGITASYFYPESIEVDEAQKTVTLTATYATGGGLFDWAKNLAQQLADMRSGSLIYENWATERTNRRELGRNNFFELFPISYQQISGFTPGTVGKERLVLAYGVAQNSAGINLPLYTPPTFNYYPAAGGDVLARDATANRFYIEISGITGWYPETSEWPVLIEGPGFSVERFGVGAASSGVTGLYPLVFDTPTGGQLARDIATWRQSDWQHNLPEVADLRSLAIIVFTAGQHQSLNPASTEAYRCNVFDAVCKSMEDLGNGYTRVTLATSKAPDNNPRVEMDSWGNNSSMINPATDTRIAIEGVDDFYAQVAVDTAAKTLTLYFDYGEGGNIASWARSTALEGSALHKRALVVHHASAPLNYFNCFPISWQLVSGVERAARGKQKVVLSYDTSAPY